MSALDYRSSGQCSVCAQSLMLRQSPGGSQAVWEHWADPYDPFPSPCPGGGKLPNAAMGEGDSG